MTENIRDISGVILSPEDRAMFEEWRSTGKIVVEKSNEVVFHGLYVAGIDHIVSLDGGYIVELGMPEISDVLLVYLREIAQWFPKGVQNKNLFQRFLSNR